MCLLHALNLHTAEDTLCVGSCKITVSLLSHLLSLQTTPQDSLFFQTLVLLTRMVQLLNHDGLALIRAYDTSGWFFISSGIVPWWNPLLWNRSWPPSLTACQKTGFGHLDFNDRPFLAWLRLVLLRAFSSSTLLSLASLLKLFVFFCYVLQ